MYFKERLFLKVSNRKEWTSKSQCHNKMLRFLKTYNKLGNHSQHEVEDFELLHPIRQNSTRRSFLHHPRSTKIHRPLEVDKKMLRVKDCYRNGGRKGSACLRWGYWGNACEELFQLIWRSRIEIWMCMLVQQYIGKVECERERLHRRIEN